jgi:phenylacetate-CoA ligase
VSASADSRSAWLSALRSFRDEALEPADERIWAPSLEACSRDELGELQGRKLRLSVRYMYDRSPLFRRKCEEIGLEPGDVGGIEDLTSLPITTKDDMSRDLERDPPWGGYTAVGGEEWARGGGQLFRTSGTTATPRSFRYTGLDLDMWAWTNARAFYSMGLRSGRDLALICFGYGPHVAMWGAHYAMREMGVPIVAAGSLPTEARALAIDTYRPTVLCATPSYALFLGAAMRDQGLDPAASSIQRVICGGEAQPPATRERIEATWGAELHEMYGCTEAAPSCGGYTCRLATHVMEDTHAIETVDPETLEPVADGEQGVSVITNLCSEASPQIRFLVGDFTTLDRSPCECGRTHVRALGGFAGRADDMLNVRGVTVFPSAIEEVVRRFPELGDEFLIVLERRGELDELTIVAEPRPDVPASAHDDLSQRLVSSVRAHCELRPSVELREYGSLPRTEQKARRVRERG